MIKKNLILVIFTSIFLFSCSQKNNIIDFDISDLPKPKKEINKSNEKENLIKVNNNKEYVKDLVTFKDKEQILSKFKFGKKDPFSEGEISKNKYFYNFKLTGFLNTKVKQYAFVSYLGNEGTISKVSIGGESTDLLPKGAKVIDIDPRAMILIINFENENLIFEL